MPKGYDPSQPREPAGSSDGGQWTGSSNSPFQRIGSSNQPTNDELFDAAIRRGAGLPIPGEPVELTKKNVAGFIEWTNSRYNAYKKDEVVKIAMEILNGTKKEYIQTGAYNPGNWKIMDSFGFDSGTYTNTPGRQPGGAYHVDRIGRYIARGHYGGEDGRTFVEVERITFK